MSVLLEVKEVSRRYGGVQALQDVSFQIAEGELFALIGPNGAGKTTLLNLISGLDRPETGRVEVEGKDITGARTWNIASLGVARTLQTPSLFAEMSALENVMVARSARRFRGLLPAILRPIGRDEAADREEAIRLLRLLGIEDAADEPAAGMPLARQRLVEIARALATEPRLLLLDEPAAGFSEAEIDRLAGLLRDIVARGVSVCLIEHNMRMVMAVAQRILVLHHGVRLFEGTPAEVRAHPEVIAAYLGSRRATAEVHDVAR